MESADYFVVAVVAVLVSAAVLTGLLAGRDRDRKDAFASACTLAGGTAVNLHNMTTPLPICAKLEIIPLPAEKP